MALKRTALAMGVGYVLGAKAGERRYAQIKEFWARTGRPLVESPSVQRFGQVGKDAVSRTVEVVANRRRAVDSASCRLLGSGTAMGAATRGGRVE